MAFHTVVSNRGMVYIFKMMLDDDVVIYKVGITSRERIEERLGEVLMSFFTQYRYVPRTTVKRFRKVDNPKGIEGKLHKLLEEYRYCSEKVFSGCTEFFHGIEEDELLRMYDEVINGRSE